MSRDHTLVFDVLGTLLDEPAAVLAAAHEAVAGAATTSAGTLAARWTALSDGALDDVVNGSSPFESLDAIMSRTLDRALEELGVDLDRQTITRLSRAGHRLEPFPDTVAAFDRLAEQFVMIGLTNGSRSQALDMSAYAGLRWHTIVSAETVGAYKPDARMYDYVPQALGVDLDRAVFVAAHPWDLDGAAGRGYRAAYVDRAGSSPQQLARFAATYDYAAPDLSALADQLI